MTTLYQICTNSWVLHHGDLMEHRVRWILTSTISKNRKSQQDTATIPLLERQINLYIDGHVINFILKPYIALWTCHFILNLMDGWVMNNSPLSFLHLLPPLLEFRQIVICWRSMLPFALWSKKRKRRWGRERKIRGEERGEKGRGEVSNFSYFIINNLSIL